MSIVNGRKYVTKLGKYVIIIWAFYLYFESLLLMHVRQIIPRTVVRAYVANNLTIPIAEKAGIIQTTDASTNAMITLRLEPMKS